MAGIDDARLRSPQAADAQCPTLHKRPREAAGVAASARDPARMAGIDDARLRSPQAADAQLSDSG